MQTVTSPFREKYTKSLERAVRTHNTRVGEIAYRWNKLQSRLLYLFMQLLPQADVMLAAKMWHAIPNDRMQRALLQSLFEQAYITKPIREKLNFLLTTANELSVYRDAFIHAPMAETLEITPTGRMTGKVTLYVHPFFASPKIKGALEVNTHKAIFLATKADLAALTNFAGRLATNVDAAKTAQLGSLALVLPDSPDLQTKKLKAKK